MIWVRGLDVVLEQKSFSILGREQRASGDVKKSDHDLCKSEKSLFG